MYLEKLESCSSSHSHNTYRVNISVLHRDSFYRTLDSFIRDARMVWSLFTGGWMGSGANEANADPLVAVDGALSLASALQPPGAVPY